MTSDLQTTNNTPTTTLDVRTLASSAHFFETFESLKPGESFLLVNDHDPKPLYYQFQAERTGEFAWNYMEQGPEVWSVVIGKTKQS